MAPGVIVGLSVTHVPSSQRSFVPQLRHAPPPLPQLVTDVLPWGTQAPDDRRHPSQGWGVGAQAALDGSQICELATQLTQVAPPRPQVVLLRLLGASTQTPALVQQPAQVAALHAVGGAHVKPVHTFPLAVQSEQAWPLAPQTELKALLGGRTHCPFEAMQPAQPAPPPEPPPTPAPVPPPTPPLTHCPPAHGVWPRQTAQLVPRRPQAAGVMPVWHTPAGSQHPPQVDGLHLGPLVVKIPQEDSPASAKLTAAASEAQ
jgi:hypothetical protein